MFAYTLVCGLLAGNANVVRVPSRDSWQIDYVSRLFNHLLTKDRHKTLSPYIACIRYDRHDTALTEYLSVACDVRVIWGGDATIDAIRKSPLKARAVDVAFADRYSLCVIDGDAWLRCTDKERYIRGFYNDTYLTDQHACSSPHLVFWLGERVKQARADFWGLLEQMVKAEYSLQGIQSVAKLACFHRMAVKHPHLRLCSNNNYIVRVWATEIGSELLNYRPGSGFFVETQAEDMSALAPLLGRGCQTLSYYGVEPHAFDDLLVRMGPLGVDRIVPIGQTLDFALTWDGHDIIRALSRKIDILRPDSGAKSSSSVVDRSGRHE